MTTRGGRIGAILGSDSGSKTVSFLGYGIYVGDEVPIEAVGWLAAAAREAGSTNPRLELESGEVVYGCECWWGDEEAVEKRLEDLEAAGYKIVQTSIEEVRREWRASMSDESHRERACGEDVDQ